MPVSFGQPLLQDLGPLLHLAQLLAVALHFLLDVGQCAGGVRLQLLQHGFLPLSQKPVQTLEGFADGGPQAFGGRLWGQSSGLMSLGRGGNLEPCPEGGEGKGPLRGGMSHAKARWYERTGMARDCK